MSDLREGFVTDLLQPGLTTCAGCGMAIAFRLLLSQIGPRSILVIPPGCGYIFIGMGSRTPLQIPAFMGNLGATAAYLSGMQAGLEVLGKSDLHLVGFAGDGATVDIGLQSLSGALERGQRFLYVCYDNEGYMNTGAQGSGSTPIGALTTTTPGRKLTPRKDIARVIAAHNPAYVATASVAYPEELKRSIQRGLAAEGSAFIHLHVPCPTGWHYPPDATIEIARLAVETGLFPLYEIIDGQQRWIQPTGPLRPVKDYVLTQGRFEGLTEEQIANIQEDAIKGIERSRANSMGGVRHAG